LLSLPLQLLLSLLYQLLWFVALGLRWLLSMWARLAAKAVDCPYRQLRRCCFFLRGLRADWRPCIFGYSKACLFAFLVILI